MTQSSNKFTRIVCMTMALVMLLGVAFAFTACNKNNDITYYDNETDALTFSLQEVDGVFNPFFSTSAMDSNVVGLTQIGMLGNDKDGNPTYQTKGDNTVMTYDFQEVTTGADDDQYTTYYFVLRNDVRCSDGSYLTIRDVLFNMYVYLDLAYTGSATMYSTDIVGLQEYRTQSDNEKEQESFNQKFQIAAEARINNLVSVCNDFIKRYPSDKENGEKMLAYLQTYAEDNNDKNIVADYNKACDLFREELQRDFNSAKDTWAELKFYDEKGNPYEHLINSDVEMFLYNEGCITWNKKDTTLDYLPGKDNVLGSTADSIAPMTEQQALSWVFNYKIPKDIEEVVKYWQTATDLKTYIANQELQEYAKQNEGTRKYKNISGIKFANMTEPVTVNGVTYDVPEWTDSTKTQIKSGNEVLSITIKGVDPKAIWNFAFAVAPMSYYSDAEHIAKFDYVENFGVEYGSQDFLQDVVKNPDKIGVPFGAGPYAASKEKGGTTGITAGEFRSLGIIYYERNEYYAGGKPVIKKVRYKIVGSSNILNALYTNEIQFAEPNAKPEIISELSGKASEGIGNQSITTLGYGYIGINAAKVPDIAVRRAIMHSIDIMEIVSYYSGAASALYRSMSSESWAYPGKIYGRPVTAYYPYIGDQVPTNLAVIGSDYANFVKEKGYKAGQTLSETDQTAFLVGLVEGAGYTKNAQGIYQKGQHKLMYTFTIAGEEKDHPAYKALIHSAEILNKIGFKIEVTTDANALSKLSSGALTVWAAAWGSTIDPDMYQVYHKDSKATSTLNWGYTAIKANVAEKYDEELKIVEELSEIIDQAREITDQEARAGKYRTALDLVMELAVELPTYQRDDLFAYNKNMIDTSTFNQNPSSLKGLISDMHKISLVTQTLEK